MITRQEAQNSFHRSVWIDSGGSVSANGESLLGDETVRYLAECGECLAILENVWPTTQTDGLDDSSQWAGEVLLSRYELAAEIGRGNFGVVYSAIDLALKREVAVKLPLQKHASNGPIHEHIALPQNEARSLAKLVHPNILRIYDVGQTEQHSFFIVSERLNGDSLAQRLFDGPLACAEAVRIFTKLADALRCAHENGVIHRDIKPANIHLDDRGEPLLVDFGLAIDDAKNTVSERGAAGTPIYMPPEQVSGDSQQSNERTDIYSFGVTLYESLAGARRSQLSNPTSSSTRLSMALTHGSSGFPTNCGQSSSEPWPSSNHSDSNRQPNSTKHYSASLVLQNCKSSSPKAATARMPSSAKQPRTKGLPAAWAAG